MSIYLSEDVSREGVLEMVKGVRQRSPYYRRKYSSLNLDIAKSDGIGDLLGRLGFMSKEEISADQQREPPFGSIFTGERPSRVYLYGGGQAMPYERSEFEELVNHWRDVFRRAGVTSNDVAQVTLNYHWVMAGTLFDAAFSAVGCTVIPGGVGNTGTHVETISRFNVTVIPAFPVYLDRLIEECKKTGVNPVEEWDLRLILLSGEVHSERQKEEWRKFLGAEIVEMYGAVEIGLPMQECSFGRGMHLNPGFIMEVIDPITGRHVGHGEGGELVFTVMWTNRKSLPMIRFRTHDVAERIVTDKCACGHVTPRMTKIIGRVGQIARTKGIFLSVPFVEYVLSQFGEVRRTQVLLSKIGAKDDVEIMVAFAGSISSDESRINKVLNDALRISVNLRLTESDSNFVNGDGPIIDRRFSE